MQPMFSDTTRVLMIVIASVLALALVITLIVYVAGPLGRGLAVITRRFFAFIGATFADIGRCIGSIVLAIVYGLLALVALIFFRVSAATRLTRAMRDEFTRLVMSLYGLFVKNPATLIGVETALEGFETRLPTVVAGALDDALGERQGMFPGYSITGTLPAGGSGAKLYIASAVGSKAAELKKQGHNTEKLVIKSFAADEEGALPALVRESRGLEAGKKLGLILDHGTSPTRFYYVMRYVPGESLRVVINKLHRESGFDGLSTDALRVAIGYCISVLRTLEEYHKGGLWHKDVKPDNIIIEAQTGNPAGVPRLVDFGLVSSLRSAMTLTTHGTEYFRDPEMVRQALRGVKVQDVDGSRFDIYSTGAVLYAMVEDSFPAQGGLSPLTKRCPPALQWVIRRAMASYDQRYASATGFAHDLSAILAAEDPYAMRPIDLPSLRGEAVPESIALPSAAAQEQLPGTLPMPATSAPAQLHQPTTALSQAIKPRVVVLNWWTGRHRVEVPAHQVATPALLPGSPQ